MMISHNQGVIQTLDRTFRFQRHPPVIAPDRSTEPFFRAYTAKSVETKMQLNRRMGDALFWWMFRLKKKKYQMISEAGMVATRRPESSVKVFRFILLIFWWLKLDYDWNDWDWISWMKTMIDWDGCEGQSQPVTCTNCSVERPFRF